MLVFALSQLLLSSLHSGLPQFHVSLNVVELKLQLLPLYLNSPCTTTFSFCPSSGYPPRTKVTFTRCDIPAVLPGCSTFKWLLSHINPFIFCVTVVSLGNTALDERGLALVWILSEEE